MKCSRRNVRAWFMIATSTAVVLSMSACKSKPKATNIGVLGSRDLVPAPYARPVANDPSFRSVTPSLPAQEVASTTAAQSGREPILPATESFVPAEAPVYVPAENAPEPEKILSAPPAAAKITPAATAPLTAPVAAASTENLRKYQIQKGDTLSGIAQCVGVKWQDIAALNPKVNPNHMMVGETLVLPAHAQDKPIVMPKSSKAPKKAAVVAVTNAVKPAASIPSDGVYSVVSGDSLWTIAHRFKLSSDDIRTWNNLKTDKLTIGQKLKLKGTAVVKETSTKTAAKAADKPEGEATKATAAELPATDKPIMDTLDELADETIVTPAEAVPTETASARAIDHLISDKDTLESIAMLYEVKLEDLLRSNPNIKSNADLAPGATIKIAYPAKK